MTPQPATFNLQPSTTSAVRLLSAQEFIEFAILFGSIARGGAGPLSDVDIGIYVSRPLDLLEIGQLVAELERALGRDVDLLVLNDAWKRNPALAYRVVTEGVVLFCRDQETLTDFKTRVFLAYFDTAFLREMVARSFQERLETGRFGKGAEECRSD
ncbi:MAG: nucleotidyltransferase domain-containing protein, partial [Oscillochloridaceae bacterium]|nr:nucleotidyltransferase domain-containing protein [Oscillochloridaceae bacterium]